MTDLTPHPEGYPIKLVRDETPGAINSSGQPGELFYAPISPEERVDWLRKKLAEELAEYLLDPGLGELADLQAVVDELALLQGEGPMAFRQRVESHPRGGFRDGIMMYGRHPEFDG